MKKLIISAIIAVGAALGLAAPAQADVFVMCPSGHSGVVGGHTSCPFADIVAGGFYAHGDHFNAYSPVTGQWYEVFCANGYVANFTNGQVLLSSRCFAGSNAEVVVW